jgi:VanZ family protein
MENPIRIHLIFACTAIVLFATVMYISLLPKVEIPEAPIIQADKFVHFSMYFLLTLVSYKGFFNKKLKSSILMACGIAFLYGIIVEVLQYSLTTTRMFDVFDIFANGIGTIFAYFAVNKYL